ncbi:hypothetical protein PG994_015132 [Apiospora phragmitis]|uniref:Inosine/uridine-preferring nucleoside hydrolase domain-containing protein n=1 Tax=Apiospora phragmitis TaxID=2905665 RepID=A0ABR1SVM0_9PEZI
MSSLQNIHDQLGNVEHVIVCVDPVDLDNIWQCLWALVRAPNAHIHAVLSPRVLDLRVPSFAGIFGQLVKEVGLRYMLDVRRRDAEEIYGLLESEDWRDYFTRDTTFQDDPHTKAHVPLYMACSALRFGEKFVSKDHSLSRVSFYWDPRSMETIVPGLHHPLHVNDQLYACTDEERREAQSILHLRGKQREERMVRIMERIADRLSAQLGYKEPAEVLHPLEDLVAILSLIPDKRSLVLGGGPFTEMVRLLTETKAVPLAIVAMARTWYADVNIFPNNYNDLMDLDAAMEIEMIIKERGIDTWFFPTECAKAKVQDGEILRACPWDFIKEELVSIFESAGDMRSYDEADAFTRETKTSAKMHMFDVLTVVPLAHPRALPYRRAESFWDKVNGERVLRIREAVDGPVQVFYPDEKAMSVSKEQVMAEISHVLSSISKN